MRAAIVEPAILKMKSKEQTVQQHKEALYRHAAIIEAYFENGFSIIKTAKQTGYSAHTVSMALTRYLAKPPQTITLRSAI